MDEFLKLREEVDKLKQENMNLRENMECKNKEMLMLNEKVASLEIEKQNIVKINLEEISKKDKTIQRLK